MAIRATLVRIVRYAAAVATATTVNTISPQKTAREHDKSSPAAMPIGITATLAARTLRRSSHKKTGTADASGSVRSTNVNHSPRTHGAGGAISLARNATISVRLFAFSR
jgi:hypothetical protein